MRKKFRAEIAVPVVAPAPLPVTIDQVNAVTRAMFVQATVSGDRSTIGRLEIGGGRAHLC